MKIISMGLTVACLLIEPLAAEVGVPAQAPEAKEGRIVVNVRNDGSITAEDFSDLKSEADIQDYVRKEKAQLEKLGRVPRLHLRGEKDALFKHGRVAVRAAAKAGVTQVLFASFVREGVDQIPAPANPQPPEALEPSMLQKALMRMGSFTKPRESDLDLVLPGPAREADKAPEIEPFVITIKGDGRIIHNEQVLDKDPEARELPLLTDALKFYKEGVELAGEKPHVRIFASDDAEHERVIDVLNALAGVGINSVTFTDLAKEGGE